MKIIKFTFGIFVVIGILFSVKSFARKIDPISTYSMEYILAEQDTIKPRYNDFINDSIKNPFDLKDPSIVEKTVEYDPESGMYIITEKIGKDYFTAPTYMTFNEYLKWKDKQQRIDYFSKLSGSGSGNRSKRGIVDPASFLNVKKDLVERIFGGNEITIKPQGSIHLKLGLSRQIMENPAFEERAQRTWNPIFDEGIQINVEGGIGDKMKLNFNYNTKASFDFDNKIKLKYDSEDFNEDAILKKIEAGNVSLPLRGNLIQGAQNLFGIKTELQFGHLRLTAIASQQRSEQKNIKIDKGAVKQTFELRPNKYDENKHFFISHYNRDAYEDALSNLPAVRTPFRITRLEVWVIPERNETHDLRDICAISDLGEGVVANYSNKDLTNIYKPNISDFYDYKRSDDIIIPDNKVSTFFGDIKDDDYTRLKSNVSTYLKSKYTLRTGRDFEVFKGKKLSSSEYSYNAELGFISLNRPLQPSDVLGVSYEYTYSYGNKADSIFKVGEFSEFSDTTGKVMYVKMLKSKAQSPDLPEWDLMMKNAYYIGTSEFDEESFKLDIFYEDKDGSLKRFMPVEEFKDKPLLEVFNLDSLNVLKDKQADGIFDVIPGITVIPRAGSIMFPVLEPFGKSLEKLFEGKPELIDKFVYNDLYRKSKVNALGNGEKNKFILKGEYKSKESNEISLGAWNIQGNPIVTSGGRTLVEGVDYDLDRGAGKIRIINPAVMQSGRPINVRFEDNSLFNLTQKNLIGLRADYEINKNFNIGATYMHLFERPYTEKVSYGDDPINNRMFGLDMDYSTEADWLTRAIDKLPIISTKAPSKISFKTEVAALKPGHSKAINNQEEKGGIIVLDDFEGASVKLYLNTENDWMISSTPSEPTAGISGGDFPESFDTTLAYGANRALLNWYVAESSTSRDNGDPYTRRVLQKELFQKDLPVGSIPDLRTFDINYYPSERGPYNFDVPEGYTIDVNGQARKVTAGVEWDDAINDIVLKDPKSRWGGIMRYMRYSDFESLNMEYIEFWMLNPFMDTESREGPDINERGKLVINLGNVSEDVLKDGLQFYENAMPLPGDYIPKTTTTWGIVPNDTPLDDAFPNNSDEIDILDVGLDGMNDDLEAVHYKDYLSAIRNSYPSAVLKDVSNDNWIYFNSDTFDNSATLLDRYKKYNMTEGNFPDRKKNERRGKLRPDKEEMNDNKSLDITESYYKYEIDLPIAQGEDNFVLDTADAGVQKYVTDTKKVITKAGNEELWYRFRIPIKTDQANAVGDINGLRSIQFMRMYFTNFEKPKTFRLAEFGMVRNQWRKRESCLSDNSAPELNLDVVGLEENQSKTPFNYQKPPGIKQERVLANYDNIRQDEKSLALKFKNLRDSCIIGVYKLTNFDARLFDKLQLFAHAESLDNPETNDLKLFIRLGKDYSNNYYEYEIPLKMSTLGDQDINNVWPDANFLDMLFKDFTDLKLERNRIDFPYDKVYQKKDEHNLNNTGAILKIKGNPSLGYIKEMDIGLTNYTRNPISGEVWINELRVSGLKEKGGVAATASLDVGLADLGSLNASFNYMSVGFGAIDQKLAQRSLEEVIDYDISTSLQMGRFFPKKWGVNLPVYLQYGQTIRKPKYDPYELDLTVDENLANAKSETEKQEFKDRALDIETVKSFNLANIGVNVGDSKYPWAPSNINVGYFYTNKNSKNAIVSNEDEVDQKLTLDYGYSRGKKYIKPFKKMKWLKAKIIKDIHFNPLPNSFSFNTQLRRYNSTRTYREPKFEEYQINYKFDDSRFTWNRDYNLQWSFTKDLDLNFTAKTDAIVDEYKRWGISDKYFNENFEEVTNPSDKFLKDYRNNSLKNLGRIKNYNHRINLSYKLPLKNIPFMKWIKVNAKYNASYDWIGETPSLVDYYGNIIKNTQQESLTAKFNFEKLYKSVKYLNKIDKGFSGKKKKSKKRRKKKSSKKSKTKDKKSKKKSKKDREPSFFEKILLRPLLTFRDIKMVFKQDRGTIVPGYTKQPEFLGASNSFEEPGYDFIIGLQPEFGNNNNGWLNDIANKGWIVNDSLNFNGQFFQDKKQSFSAKIKLEPINNLQIDVEFKKAYVKNNSRGFKYIVHDGTGGFESLSSMDRGSFEVSYFAMNTMFTKDYQTLFDKFSDYRKTISKRQALIVDNDPNNLVIHPDHPHNPDDPEDLNYYLGYGPQSQDVLIPAFLAAYTGKNPDKVNLNIYDSIGEIDYIPKPQWRATFNLGKYSFFKGIFSSIKITNGYKSMLKVSSIQSDLNYFNKINDTGQRVNGRDDNEKNYYSEYIIPAMVLDERFDPVIGIDLKTKSDLSLRFEYKKSRSMLLSQKSLQQNRTEEIVFNFGYIVKDVYIPFLSKKPKKSKRKDKKEKEAKGNSGKKSKTGRKSKSSKNNLRDLRISVDFSIRDNEVTEYLFDKGRNGKPTHGNYRVSLTPTMEYNISDNFSVQADFSYDMTKPYVNNSYPSTNYRGTVTAKYALK